MPSWCQGPFFVENVDEMNFPEVENDDFMTTHDHAKWAISLDKKNPWICIGDINRYILRTNLEGQTKKVPSLGALNLYFSNLPSVENCNNYNYL